MYDVFLEVFFNNHHGIEVVEACLFIYFAVFVVIISFHYEIMFVVFWFLYFHGSERFCNTSIMNSS